MSDPKGVTRFWGSVLLYIAMFAVWAFWDKTRVVQFLPEWIPFILGNAISVTLIWVIPWLPLLRWQEGWQIPPRKMFTRPPLTPLVICLCASVAFLHTLRLAAGNSNTIVFFDIAFVVLAVSASVTEELAFRGLLFNWQVAAIGTKKATVVNGVLFALYHFPQLLWRQGIHELIGMRGLLLFVMGVLFSLAFARWGSLPLTMIVHAVWNLLSYLFALAG